MPTPRPLVIDLDGTLIRSDVLLETSIAYLRDHPLRIFPMLEWLAAGKATFKARLAHQSKLDLSLLPYEPTVLELIAQARSEGRELVLATASHEKHAREIADHLGCFDRVLATSEVTGNLKGQAKADLLVAEFGQAGFDYAGNSRADLPVWEAAAKGYVVNPDTGVLGAIADLSTPLTVLCVQQHPWRALLRAMRCHQWVKNILLFVPLLAGHQLLQFQLLIPGLLAFLCFGLCASSIYLFNDLLDLADDRQHPGKRQRPFAAGTLPFTLGLAAIPILLVLAFAIAASTLPFAFVLMLSCYCLLTLAYSLFLKRRVMVDVIVLAGLYTLRLLAGTFVFETSITFWLLAFSVFIFLSLALVKRCAELDQAIKSGESPAAGRGYVPDDLPVLYSLGTAAGYLSVLVLALYIQDENTRALYSSPEIIWLACPLLLYWVSRVWLITHRGGMHDDPVVFAFKDRVSLVTGLLFGFIFWAAV